MATTLSNASGPDKPVIVALDFPNAQAALNLVDRLSPQECRLKIGKELFTLCGPELVREVQSRGFEVFLDLKFHDIPNTTAAAVRAAAELGVWMVNVHAAGGEAMMKACREALEPFGENRPKLIAVTVLTSMADGDLAAIGVGGNAQDQVLRLARLASECGMDGVVCSAREASMLKEALGEAFMLVTPGIRPESADKGDQQRVMTPVEALAAGSDYLVIGRPITKAGDPSTALAEINQTLSAD